MRPTKLQRIQFHLETKLIKDLPVTYNNLIYIEPEDIEGAIRLVQSPGYSTRFHVSSSHHKPISKCLKQGDE